MRSKLFEIAKSLQPRQKPTPAKSIERFKTNGSIPWSQGYEEYRWELITETIQGIATPPGSKFQLPFNHGVGIDERCVEYPWLFDQLRSWRGKLLDAGSTLNHKQLVSKSLTERLQITFANLAIEPICLFPLPVSYILADLCNLPFSNDWFDATTCISVLEHVGLDNAIYGHSPSSVTEQKKSWKWTKAVSELTRVTNPNGTIAITVPVGEFKNYGFFQQFDTEMVDRMVELLAEHGQVSKEFYYYGANGWTASLNNEWTTARSHNPHTGEDKGTDGAAHCRAIGCFVARPSQTSDPSYKSENQELDATR